MVTLTPSPLTVVVLVSMNNVFHLRILLCNPLFQYCCKNNRTLGASSLSSTSIFYLQCRPWFNIYHFIQLCSCTLDGILSKVECDNLSQVLSTRSRFYRNIMSTLLLTECLEYISRRVFPL